MFICTSPKDRRVLSNGLEIPCIGFGTYKSVTDDNGSALLSAIDAGYRLLDTAAYYHNEEAVGEAVRTCGIPRSELFITSKVWRTEAGYEKAVASFEQSLRKLGLDTLDLLLIHWPATYLQYGAEAKKVNADTWRAFETLYRGGRVKAIGLSNFMAHHIEALLETAEIKPMVNQIEFHPGWYQAGVLRYCEDNGILTQAWSPMGRGAVLTNETVTEIAVRCQKTPAQVCIRWVLQHGVLPLPKSVHPDRIRKNLEVFDFELTPEEMERLDELGVTGGECSRPDDIPL